MNDDKILVSIVCNAYNHEKYIKDALEGFVMQKTSFSFEVLIHDDASTDNTASIIREYEAKYPDIIKPIYETENQYSKHDGSIKKIQSSRIKGKYVALCEGDDYWTDPQKLQKQFDFLETHPEYSMCATSADWVNVMSGKTLNKGTTLTDKDFSTEELIEKRVRPFATAAYFMIKDVYLGRPQFGFPIGDYPMLIYASLLGKVRMLPDNTCVYRYCAEGSWTVKTDNEETRANISDQMIIGLKNLNEYTGGKYEVSIKKRIKSQKFTSALLRHDFKTLKSDELIELFNKNNIFRKFSFYLHCKFPKSYRWLMGIMKINGHSN